MRVRRNLSRPIVVQHLSGDFQTAKRLRETFYGKPFRKTVQRNFGWPRRCLDIGACNAQLYESDKFIDGGDDWEIYKHLAEGPQRAKLNPATTRIADPSGRPIRWVRGQPGPDPRSARRNGATTPSGVLAAMPVELSGPLPRYVSDFAQNRGVQIAGSDGNFYEIQIPESTLAGAIHPRTHQPFLLVYSDEGVHMIITGDDLHVTRHGIGG